jgi:glycerophosphoryl diester phosphodiesterase
MASGIHHTADMAESVLQDRAMEPLLRPPIGFAHRGARAHAPDNTLESFQLALRLGATGLESDVWLTSDGVPVLDHDGLVKSGLRRRPLGSVPRAGLPPHVPTLAELYETCGTGYQLSLDIKDERSVPAVIAVARAAGDGAPARLWLCHASVERLASWRSLSDQVRLVNSTRLRRIREGPEQRAANLANSRIDAINMHVSDWTGGLTTLFHRFERLALAWDAQHARVLGSMLEMGCDGVYSDHVDRMVEALKEAQL